MDTERFSVILAVVGPFVLGVVLALAVGNLVLGATVFLFSAAFAALLAMARADNGTRRQKLLLALAFSLLLAGIAFPAMADIIFG